MTYTPPYEREFLFNPNKRVSKSMTPIFWVDAPEWKPIFQHVHEGPTDRYRIQFVGDVRDLSFRIRVGNTIFATYEDETPDTKRFQFNLVTRRILEQGRTLCLDAKHRTRKHTAGRVYSMTGSIFQYPGDETMFAAAKGLEVLKRMYKEGKL